MEALAENGLSGANADAIAAPAGVTNRLVFYYVTTKEALFTAVLEMADGRMRAESGLWTSGMRTSETSGAQIWHFDAEAPQSVGAARAIFHKLFEINGLQYSYLTF